MECPCFDSISEWGPWSVRGRRTPRQLGFLSFAEPTPFRERGLERVRHPRERRPRVRHRFRKMRCIDCVELMKGGECLARAGLGVLPPTTVSVEHKGME